MNIKALIYYDLGYGKESLQNLTKQLSEQNIDPFVFTDPSKLIEIIKSFDENQPLIYFKNQLIRITNLLVIKNWFNSNKTFTGLRLKNLNTSEGQNTFECISFYPKSLKETNSGLIYLKDYFFDCSNIYYKIDLMEKPVLFIYTYNRNTYFKLTLDSLNNSLLNSIEKPKIVILLNDKTKENVDISLNFKQKYENVDILSIFPNSFFSAISLALQIYKTNKFIVLEDDFILANCSNKLYSSWAHLFFKRLDYFDFVGWTGSLLNYPFSLSPNPEEQVKISNNLYKGILWNNVDQNTNKVMLSAQSLACKTSFYKDILKKHNKIPTDDILFKYAFEGLNTPSMFGYHIGWNQEQMGLPKLNTKRFPDNFGFVGKYIVENLITGEKFNNMCPKDLS